MLSHHISYIIIRYVSHDSHWSEVWGKEPVFIGGIEEERDDTERNHNGMLMLCLSAQVDDNVHYQNSRQVPK